MTLLQHWPTAIRKAVTQFFMSTVLNNTIIPPFKVFVGEDKRSIDQYQIWSEMKLFGPFFGESADGRDTSIRLQVRIECYISTQKGENIYDITTMMGIFAQACSLGIPILEITEPHFCLNSYNIRTIERGLSETKIPLKIAYVEADYEGVIEAERIIGQ